MAGASRVSFNEEDELERILKAKLSEMAIVQQRKLMISLEQSRADLLETVTECLAKVRTQEMVETWSPDRQEDQVELELRRAPTESVERGSGFGGVPDRISESSFQEDDQDADAWMETVDLKAVKKMDTSSLLFWIRLKLAKLEHRVLDVAVSLLIAMNVAVMMLSHQQMGHDAARVIGKYDSGMDSMSISKETFRSIEQAFAIIFFLELSARLMIHRLKYFRSALNIFDALLVVIGLVDTFILAMLERSGGINLVILRFLRILKLARTLRALRTMRLFQGLRVLVAAVSSFLPSLCWSMFFLAIFIILGGLLIGMSLIDFIEDESKDLETRKWVWESYGTSYRATYTMFQVTFAGCWPAYVNPLFEHVSMWYALFFCLYVTFVVFAVMRVITAIFLKETLDAAGEDHEVVMSEKEATKKKYMRKLERIFSDMDVSGDGLISEEEFTSMLQDEKVKQYLVGLEVDLNESNSLFHMMADDEGPVSYSRFMDGMNRAKGLAKAADILCIRHDLTMLRKDLKLVKALSGHGLSEEERNACFAVSRTVTTKAVTSTSGHSR